MNQKVQVWVVYRDEVLMLRVIPERGSAWHPITGGVEKGETNLEGAQRETLEETGIEKKAGDWLDLDFSFEYKGRWGRAREHSFALVLKKRPKKITIDPTEHTEYDWMKMKKVTTLLSFEKQKESLEKLVCILSKI